MKKVILQYLASALAVILILGLVVFNRQRNHSLVKKVKDPEISYIYQDSLENIDINTLNTMCANLHNEPLFAPEEMKEGLSSEEKVKGRITSAINVFSHG